MEIFTLKWMGFAFIFDQILSSWLAILSTLNTSGRGYATESQKAQETALKIHQTLLSKVIFPHEYFLLIIYQWHRFRSSVVDISIGAISIYFPFNERIATQSFSLPPNSSASDIQNFSGFQIFLPTFTCYSSQTKEEILWQGALKTLRIDSFSRMDQKSPIIRNFTAEMRIQEKLDNNGETQITTFLKVQPLSILISPAHVFDFHTLLQGWKSSQPNSTSLTLSKSLENDTPVDVKKESLSQKVESEKPDLFGIIRFNFEHPSFSISLLIPRQHPLQGKFIVLPFFNILQTLSL